MAYKIKLEQFEGPLTLLLELIEKRKLSINEISLAAVTDQYIEHLKTIENFSLEEVSSFVAIASTLLLIKSASLIPTLELSEEERGDIKNLERRLLFYRIIKNAALILGENFGKNPMFRREAFLGYHFEFLEPKGVNRENLSHILKQIIAAFPKKEALGNAVVKKTISLEKKISEILKKIQEQMEFSFSPTSATKGDKLEIIISFLAILELIKKGFIIVEQTSVFQTIKIRKRY